MLSSLTKLRRVSCTSMKMEVSINLHSLIVENSSTEFPICVVIERKYKRKSSLPRKPIISGVSKKLQFEDSITFLATLFRQANGSYLPKSERLNIVEIISSEGQQRAIGDVILHLDSYAGNNDYQTVSLRVQKDDADVGAVLSFSIVIKQVDDASTSDDGGASLPPSHHLQLTWGKAGSKDDMDSTGLLSNPNHRLHESEEENSLLRRQIDEMQAGRIELGRKIELLESQVMQLQLEPSADVDIISTLERDKAVLRRQVEQLSAQLMSLTSVMSETVESLQTDLQQQSDRVIELETENYSLQNQVEFLSTQVVTMSSEMGKTVEMLQSGLQLQAKQQQQQLQSVLSADSRSPSLIDQERQRLQDEVEELTQQLRAAKGEASHLRQELYVSQVQVKQLNSHHSTTQSKTGDIEETQGLPPDTGLPSSLDSLNKGGASSSPGKKFNRLGLDEVSMVSSSGGGDVEVDDDDGGGGGDESVAANEMGLSGSTVVGQEASRGDGATTPSSVGAGVEPKGTQVALLISLRWAQDADHPDCMEVTCRQPFGIFSRHHCRLCGGLFCGNCARFKTLVNPTVNLGTMRICKACTEDNKAALDMFK